MLQQLEELAEIDKHGYLILSVELVEVYEIITEMGPDVLHKEDVTVYLQNTRSWKRK